MASYIVDHYPELGYVIAQLQAELNDIWQDGLKGKSVIREFKATQGTWRNLKLQAIEIFKNKTGFEKLCLW